MRNFILVQLVELSAAATTATAASDWMAASFACLRHQLDPDDGHRWRAHHTASSVAPYKCDGSLSTTQSMLALCCQAALSQISILLLQQRRWYDAGNKEG